MITAKKDSRLCQVLIQKLRVINSHDEREIEMANIKDRENAIVMETTKGTVFIELFPNIAPNHVARIKKLTREGFYDGCTFHRVIDGFMAQTGDPSGTGREGSDYGPLKSEFSNRNHLRGICSMARAGHPDSADSQFFICFGDCPFLNGQYTVWGQVIEGMNNIDKLERVEPPEYSDKLERGGPPGYPDKIISMRVVADVN